MDTGIVYTSQKETNQNTQKPEEEADLGLLYAELTKLLLGRNQGWGGSSEIRAIGWGSRRCEWGNNDRRLWFPFA